MYEKVKDETYKYYKDFMETTKCKDIKSSISPMKISKTADELYIKNQNMNRIIINLRNKDFKMECNTTLKYNMPLPLNKTNILKGNHAKL